MTLYISVIKYKYKHSNKLIAVNIHSSIISSIKYVYSYIVNDSLQFHKKLPFYIKNTDDLRDFFNTYPTKFEWTIEEKTIIDEDDEEEDEEDYERDIETCTIHN